MKQKAPDAFEGNYGFTLIELLVVMSVITLLMSILIPALGKVRAQAQQIVCQSQLRQWGLAFETYACANKGFYPHIDGWDRGEGGANDFGWVDMLPPLMGEKSWRDYPNWHKPTKGIFQCPSARPYSGCKYNIDKFGYFSYAMNSCLELDRGCWSPYGQPGLNNMPSFLDTAKIENPVRVILLFDQLLDPTKGYGGEELYDKAGKNCGSYPRAFSARHYKKRGGLGGSILFCDYHVEWIETVWKPEWPKDDYAFQAPPRDDLDWYPYQID